MGDYPNNIAGGFLETIVGRIPRKIVLKKSSGNNFWEISRKELVVEEIDKRFSNGAAKNPRKELFKIFIEDIADGFLRRNR